MVQLILYFYKVQVQKNYVYNLVEEYRLTEIPQQPTHLTTMKKVLLVLMGMTQAELSSCLLYTSDAADEE